MTGFRFLFIAVENGFYVFAEFWACEAVFLQPQLKILKIECKNLEGSRNQKLHSKGGRQHEESGGIFKSLFPMSSMMPGIEYVFYKSLLKVA